MATIDKNRDERGNAIVTYYSGLTSYNVNTIADGTDVESSKPQMKFKAFNDLIKLFHDELKVSVGYASSSTAYMPSDEGVVGTAPWWTNANTSNLRTELFYNDSTVVQPTSEYYILNTKVSPDQRHPFLFWNQKNSAIGGFGNYGWKNAASFAHAQNPFATGSSYSLGEPLEYYGSASNILWGAIVSNNEYSYRSRHFSGSTPTHTDTGFVNLERSGASIGEYIVGDWSSRPSPYEIFTYTKWGSGANTLVSSSVYITNHSATGDSGSFDGAISAIPTQYFSIGAWYIIHGAGLSSGWVIYCTNCTLMGTSPNQYYHYEYDHADWPIPATGNLNGTWSVYVNPLIPGTVKTGGTSDGRRNIWSSVYSQYYSTFKLRADAITSIANGWITALNNILAFDYTIIIQEAGSALDTSPTTSAFKTSLNNWITAWKALINDTGSGATFSTIDADWGDAHMTSLLSDGSGGINQMITFAGSLYYGAQTGLIASRRSSIYTLLGDYSLGSSELWVPGQSTFIENNSGSFTTHSLYDYRFQYADLRLNRESGLLTAAYSGYKTYTTKLAQIATLTATLLAQLAPDTNHKYDITPTVGAATKDNEDNVVVSWDAVKAAASYDIDRKEGLNGSWTRIQSRFDYVDPGNTPYPDFSHNPASEYTDSAYTLGYQSFGASISNLDDTTGLADDFTLYDFNLALDGASAIAINIKGMDAKTWEAMRVTLQKTLDAANLAATASITSSDMRITSNKKGTGSSVVLTAGVTNNLFAALGITPPSGTVGNTVLKQGKVYYYRFKVDNGWDTSGDIVLADGLSTDKDWDSQSDYQLSAYLNARATHGDAGMIVWDEPANLKAGGIDAGVAASDLHCRLEWDAALNAASYKIYRATSNDGGYALIGTTSNTYYEDTTGIAGFVYYYKISAVADSNQQLYDSSGNLTGPIESLKSPAGVRGKKLWQTMVISASTTDSSALTLSWNALSGANGYLLYKAPIENGQYSYLANDDATPLIITSTTYIDAQPARQFFSNDFTSTSDGIASGDYVASHRYYFVIICTGVKKETTVYQYYITSPSSGTWTCQNIASAIQIAINKGLNNAHCDLVYLVNPEPAHYKIRFTTQSAGTDTSIQLLDGTFGDSLLPLLGGVASPEIGQGAYPAIPTFYKVQAVEVVGGEIVRSSELSNIAQGVRPVI